MDGIAVTNTNGCRPEQIALEARVRGIERIDVTMLDGLRLAVWCSGLERRDAKAIIVLLHGVTYSSLAVFDLVIPGMPRHAFSTLLALAQASYIACAVDMDGYGFSEARPRLASISDYSDDLAAVCSALRSVAPRLPLVLLGWSWGGQVASHCCGTYEAADALVFYGSLWGGGPSGLPERFRNGVLPPSPRRTNSIEHAGADFANPAHYDAQAKRAFVQRALCIDPTSPVGGIYEVARGEPLHSPAALKAPSLVIHGDHDPIISAGDILDFYHAIPHARKTYAVVPKADHNAHLGHARLRFLQILCDFLEGHV
jgi:pimeloyl-ACP methyl ester carboxylesterase